MRHEIDVQQHGPGTELIAAAVQSCVHCGFCLPTCPTYATLGEEMDSPRGRIFLVKEVLEGGIAAEAAQPYLDNCLGCQACVTACPSGVQYGDLITQLRLSSEPGRRRPIGERARRALLHRTLPYPRRMRLAIRAGTVARQLAPVLPDALAPMLELLPGHVARSQPLPAVHPADPSVPRRARVALLVGCAQQVLAPEITWATLRVLARNGVETVIPPGQGCCGALALHAGERDLARRLARRNLDAFGGELDALVTNAAGCGSGMREYPLLFRDTAHAQRASALAEQVRDISEFLAELGITRPAAIAGRLRIAYHDACHLTHAQGVHMQPRELLESIPGVEVVTPREWELCCGSAGTYNAERPEIARRLGARKAANLAATDARLVATGNIGCITQIRAHLQRAAPELEVVHTVEVLDRAYAGTLTEQSRRTSG